MLNLKRLKDFFSKKNSKERIRERLKETLAEDDAGSTEKKSPPGGKKLSKKEKRELKKSRPLPLRILKQFLKTVFIRVPLLLIVIVAAVLFFLGVYLKAPVVEKLAKSEFSKLSYGTLDMKVESFDLYRGFVIKNIVVRSGEDFGREKLFEMEKFVFSYGFFPIFTGSVRFPEIGLYKPRAYLVQRKGVWNAAALMKPSEKKPEKEKEPEKKKDKETDEPSSKEIKLPISVDFLFKFILDDMCVYVNSPDFTTEMTGLSFNANIDIPPFKVIPKSVEAVRILKTMRFELNPRNGMNVKFYSKDAATAPELVLNWSLVFNNGDKPEFNSTLNAGAKRMPLRLKNKFFSPFSFLVAYDIFYNPVNDILRLNDFSVSFMNSYWLKLTGSVGSVTKSQELDIRMVQSSIKLKDLYPYFVLMTGDRSTKFGGEISLFPLVVKGNAKNPDVRGKLSLNNIYFKIPGTEASIPYLGFDYSAALKGSTANIGAELNIPHLAYVIEGSKSGDNGIKLTASATGYNNFKQVKINSVTFDFFHPSAGKAVSLGINGDVSLGKATQGSININKLRINTSPLTSMVPGRFRKQVADIPLKKPVDLNMNTNFYLGGDIINAGVELLAAVPDYNVNDLRLKASISQNSRAKRITLENIYLGSRNMNLAVNAGGVVELQKAPLSDSNLRVSVELNNPKMKSVWGPWNTSGQLKLSAFMKGDLATGKAHGSLVFKDFNLKNDEQKLAVSGFNMNFPFEYEFKARKGSKSYISVTQNQVIESGQFSDRPNFTIGSISAKHPTRNESFEYMKGFSAFMIFSDNVFRISDLKANVMDGSIYGRKILFNLADFNLDNMEFAINLDVSNVNIGRLDDPTKKNISKSAELSLTSNFSGKGLNVSKELNPSGNINIYEIGKKFGSRLMKGLSQEKGESKLGKPVQKVVDNSIPRSFDFRLDKGLVYTKVKFSGEGIISKIVKTENDEVTFDRIPIQEFLRKVSEAE